VAAAAPASAAAVAASAPASAVAAAASAATAAPAASAAASAVTSDPKTVLASAFRSEKDAWRALATQWKLTLDDGEPCAAAAKQQLQCFRSGNSTLALIRLLDRPVLLTLQGGGGKPSYALLTGLSMRQATLRTEAGLQSLPLASLAELWRGEFATLWRAPPGYADGAPVDWLSTQLAAAQGQPAPSAPTRFDAALRSRLNAFQVAQGLKPDGLAGPLTLMQINRAISVDEPHLQDER
jgi:general secretion pathway protein A